MTKIKIFTLIISFLLINYNEVYSQPKGRVDGQISDYRTNGPISNVNVTVNRTDLGAATDLDGKFTITGILPGTYTLTLSSLGYETQLVSEVIISSARPALVKASMIPTAIQSEEVVVRPGLFVRELKASVSRISRSNEEIRRYPGGFEDVVRTVASLPGVAVVNDGGRNDLLVRGGGPSENLYIIDNMEVPNINHFGNQGGSNGSLSFINLDFIDQVEFTTGGFGAEYGDKMSSVLALKMRPGRSDKLGGRLTLSATQFAMDAEGPMTEKGSFIFSARQSYLDLIFKAAGLPFIPTYTDFNLFSEYEISPKRKISFIGLAAIDKIERDQSTLENRVTNAGIMDNTQNQYVFGTNFRQLIKKGHVDFTLNLNRNEYFFSQVDENEIEYFGSDATEMEIRSKLASAYVINDKTRISGGISFTSGQVDNSTAFADTIYNNSGRKIAVADLGLPQQVEQTKTAEKYSAFASLERMVLDRLEVTLGLRMDYFNFINEPLYPALRTSLNYKISRQFRAKMSFGTYYQSPSYVWVANPFNKDLKALKNNMAVIGGYYLPLPSIQLSAELYLKNYSDLPAGATPETNHLILSNTGIGYGGREDNFVSFGYLPLESTGKGIAYGAEFQMQKKFAEDCCYGQAGLSFSRSEFEAPNGEIYPGPFDQTVIINLSWGFKPNSKWEYSAKFRYWTGAPYTPVYIPDENNGELENIPEEYLSERLNPGHHLDIRIDRRFDFGGWAMIAYVDIQNIYNNLIQIRPRYDFWEKEITDRAGLGILPSIGLRVFF
ncbi:MAG: TonB-dependent receptor [Calditrichaeota bacterium]|nr:TonB-dependent receptor [Calditrichota bacterium]MBT7789246.1 TonB-dependent receptor [Calditrichota bacterium]